MRAVLLLMRVQLALRSRRAPKRYITDTLSEHGLDFEGAIKSLERMGYIVSVDYKGSYVMLTTKGENARV